MRLIPSTITAAVLVLAGAMLGSTACGPREAPAPAPAPAPSTPPAPPTATPVPPSKAETPAAAMPSTAPLPTPKATQTPAAKAAPAEPAAVKSAAPAPVAATSTPAPEAKPVAAPAPKPAPPVQDASPVSDPGGEVAVKATKAGLSRVGVSSCKMCHKVQFASWSETAHAKRMPPLDCESCHGSGSEFKAMPVMKDPAKAAAAGMVLPKAAFCATCHKRGWNDGMLQKAHAHKP